MTILDRIRSLANDRKVTLAELERNLNFSNGSLRKWETSTPSGDKIEKIADYFNVSTDYLLGRTDNPTIANKKNNSFSKAKKSMLRNLPLPLCASMVNH